MLCVHPIDHHCQTDSDEERDDDSERDLSWRAGGNLSARRFRQIDDLYLSGFDCFSHLRLLQLGLEILGHLLNRLDLFAELPLFSFGCWRRSNLRGAFGAQVVDGLNACRQRLYLTSNRTHQPVGRRTDPRIDGNNVRVARCGARC